MNYLQCILAFESGYRLCSWLTLDNKVSIPHHDLWVNLEANPPKWRGQQLGSEPYLFATRLPTDDACNTTEYVIWRREFTLNFIFHSLHHSYPQSNFKYTTVSSVLWSRRAGLPSTMSFQAADPFQCTLKTLLNVLYGNLCGWKIGIIYHPDLSALSFRCTWLWNIDSLYTIWREPISICWCSQMHFLHIYRKREFFAIHLGNGIWHTWD